MKMSSLDEELNKELFFVAMMLFISFLSVYIFQRILKQKNKEIASVNNNLEELVYKRNKTLTTTLDQTIAAFVELVESRDTYTAGHSRRVQYYSNLIASYMNLDSDTVERIDNAALVHDIGKIHTPDAVLLKPGHLTSEEYHLIQSHAESGYSTLVNIDEYKHLAYIVKTHHERWDGNGYPSGISGENIPLEARIIAVADTFDAMTTNRIYKPRMNVQEALNEIQRLSNKDFDPNVVNAAMAILGKIKLDNTSQLPINVNDEERMAYHFKDKLTGLYNREYLILLIEKGFNARKFECINIVCLKKFHQYNKNCGWSNGNEILIEFAKQLKKRFSESYLFRIHGDDFVILNFTHFELSVSELDTCTLFENTPIEIETRHFDLRQGVDRTSIEEILGNG